MAQALNFKQLAQKQGTAIDTRASAFYNGWPQSLNGPSGHEPSALNLSARWLDNMSDEQLNARIQQHQLKSDAPVAVYGSDSDVQAVKSRLQRRGCNRLLR